MHDFDTQNTDFYEKCHTIYYFDSISISDFYEDKDNFVVILMAFPWKTVWN